MAEYNLIQSPELIRRLTKFLGLRQAHIVPTLDENVVASIILADISKEPEFLPRRFAAQGQIDGDSTSLGFGFRLDNPVASGVVARVTRITATLFSTLVAGGDIMHVEICPVTSLLLSNTFNTVRGRDWRKGISTLSGIPATDQPSALFLSTGTANAAVGTLTQWSIGARNYRSGAPGTDAIAVWDVDTEPWGIFLQPGFSLYCVGTDPSPIGRAAMQWEERGII